MTIKVAENMAITVLYIPRGSPFWKYVQRLDTYHSTMSPCHLGHASPENLTAICIVNGKVTHCEVYKTASD
jgi:hypothetical protein